MLQEVVNKALEFVGVDEPEPCFERCLSPPASRRSSFSASPSLCDEDSLRETEKKAISNDFPLHSAVPSMPKVRQTRLSHRPSLSRRAPNGRAGGSRRYSSGQQNTLVV
eukprot:8667400-Pyramimonas_sp.AAC.1